MCQFSGRGGYFDGLRMQGGLTKLPFPWLLAYRTESWSITSRQIPHLAYHFPEGNIFHESHPTGIFVALQQKFIECVCSRAYGKNVGLKILLTSCVSTKNVCNFSKFQSPHLLNKNDNTSFTNSEGRIILKVRCAWFIIGSQ